MRSATLYWRWIHIGVLLINLIPGIAANDKYTQYSNISAPTSISTSTSTSTSHSTITSCATLGRLDYFPASLRSLPASVLASITLSEAARLQEIIRSFARIVALPLSDINLSIFESAVSIFTSEQHRVVSELGSSGYAYLNFPGFTDPCLLSTCVDQFLSQGSSATAANPSGLWVYQAQSPCCGQCSITANAVEVLYWPTPAQTPLVTALVDPAINFTYVSPSVYAIFTDLSAENKCGPVGGVYYPLLTGRFGPTELSTSSIPVNPDFSAISVLQGQWTAIHYTDFGPQCTCTANCEFDPLQNRTLSNLCTPQLSIPSIITELVPVWATCGQDLLGAFDPPIALSLAGGLTTPKNTPAQPSSGGPGGGVTTSPGPTAAPVNSPSPPVVAPTPPPQPEPSNAPPTQINPIPSAQSNNPSPPPVQSQPANSQPINSQPVNPQPVNSQPANLQPINSQPTNPLPSNPSPVISQGPAPGQVQPSSAIPIVPGVPIIIANTVLTPAPGASSIFIVGSQTLVPGGPAITVNGATISLPPSGTAIIIAGSATTAPPVLTINGQTVTANSQSDFVIGTQTLIPGAPAITVSGTPISLAPGATEVVVGGTTTPLGSIIMSVFNGGTGTSSAAETGSNTETSVEGVTATGVAPAEFTGGAVGKGKNAMGGGFVYVGVLLSALMIWL